MKGELENAEALHHLARIRLALDRSETTVVEGALPAFDSGVSGDRQARLGCDVRSRQSKDLSEEPCNRVPSMFDTKTAVPANCRGRRVKVSERLRKPTPRIAHHARVKG